jgi:hypothetical protein
MQSKSYLNFFTPDHRFNKANLVGWYQAEVILALDEMIRVKIYTPASGAERPIIGDGGAATWIEKESNKLAK